MVFAAWRGSMYYRPAYGLLLLPFIFSSLCAETAGIELPRLAFIPNLGQWHSDVLFRYRTVGLDAWGTRYGLNLTFYQITGTVDPFLLSLPVPEAVDAAAKSLQIRGHRVLIEFEGSSPSPVMEGREPQPGYLNYLKSNDPGRHVRFVPLYGEVLLRGIYPGIDTRYYLEDSRLRFDFWVAAGADPSRIRLKLAGAEHVRIEGNALVFETQPGTVRLCELRAYQAGRLLTSRFIQTGDSYQIAVEDYDPTLPLIIDPMVYSTYVGGTGFEWGTGIAVNSAGEAFISGWTASNNYDITPGAFQTTFLGLDYDAFVTKLSATGGTLIYSTYLGGNNLDQAGTIAIDATGNAYVTGTTKSTNFPVTAGAFQTTHGGGAFMYDGFIAKLDPSGASLVYSTFLGSSSEEGGVGIAVNGAGEAFVSGWTTSPSFPITPGAAQTVYGGGFYDAFVTRLNATGTALVYSTYIGGNGDDRGLGIAVDASDNAYITGWTTSTNFPVSAGAYQTTYGGGIYDVFAVRLNAAGNSRIYSTYIGGSGEDRGFGITVDGSGEAYIAGWTASSNYDVTSGAFQTTYGGGAYDAFATKLNPTGTALSYSTYIGGSQDDRGMGIAVDATGRAYVTGGTASPNYPATTGAFQTAISNAYDVILTALNPAGNGLEYSTFIGGTGTDIGNNLAIDQNGDVYLTGGAGNCFPVTLGAFQTTWEGGSATIPSFSIVVFADAFVSKLCLTAGCGIVCGGACTSCAPLASAELRLEARWKEHKQVSLLWQAQGAAPFVAFSLQKLMEARWSEQAFLNGHTLSYSTEQVEPLAFYRLVGLTADGRSVLSNVAVVRAEAQPRVFSLFPNPATTQSDLVIFPSTSEIHEYEVLNATGALVARLRATEESLTVRVAFAPGVYWIRECRTGQIQKLVVVE